jgi:hypothetical protein
MPQAWGYSAWLTPVGVDIVHSARLQADERICDDNETICRLDQMNRREAIGVSRGAE